MPDKISAARRSENMRQIRSKSMKPEMAVRSLSHRLGYRHRLHNKELPGKPDLVYPGRKKVIFVHGCFWHQHGDPDCKISRRPKSNLDYWDPKLDRNIKRDAQNQAKLKELGWDYMIVWECQVKGLEKLAERIENFLD